MRSALLMLALAGCAPEAPCLRWANRLRPASTTMMVVGVRPSVIVPVVRPAHTERVCTRRAQKEAA